MFNGTFWFLVKLLCLSCGICLLWHILMLWKVWECLGMIWVSFGGLKIEKFRVLCPDNRNSGWFIRTSGWFIRNSGWSSSGNAEFCFGHNFWLGTPFGTFFIPLESSFRALCDYLYLKCHEFILWMWNQGLTLFVKIPDCVWLGLPAPGQEHPGIWNLYYCGTTGKTVISM